MTPAELAKSGSEHGTQRALFAWARMAEAYCFEIAWDDRAYTEQGWAAEAAHGVMSGQGYDPSVPEIGWLHAIPNGGLRDKKTAGQMKAEGVKRGICDIFLPLPFPGPVNGRPGYVYAGLYVEMKRAATMKAGVRKAQIIDRAAGTTSEEQNDFVAYARRVGYAVSVCFDWQSAAKEIQRYIEMVRNGG